ncbi:MAG: hypothetical protein ACOCYB_08635, partial [Alkalispirochaeta sp.]
DLSPPDDNAHADTSEVPRSDQDWFDIPKTALELAEDDEVVAGNAPMSSDEEGAEGAEGDRVAQDEPAPVGEVAELEAIEESGDVAELEPLEEADLLEEIPVLTPIDQGTADESHPENLESEHLPELEVASHDVTLDEEIEDLEYEATGDDESEPVEVEATDHQPTPFFSASSSFGSTNGPVRWRPDIDLPSRPSVYRADEIRPQAVAIRGIEHTGTHHVIDLDDFVAFAGRNQSVIEERDGLIRIEAAAYFGEYRDIDQRTQALAEQVMTRHMSQGIDAVLGASFGDLDFGDILGSDEPSSIDAADTSDSTLRVVSGGFDLPYVDAGGETGVRQVYRQLVRLTRRWDARVALLLEETPNRGLRGGFGLGMPEQCREPLSLGADSDLATTIVPHRRVVLLKEPLSVFRDFVGSCQADKLSAINSWLLLPLKDSDHRRYLMVGFSRTFEDLMDLAGKYEIIPRAV